MFHVSIDSLTLENFGPFYGVHELDFVVEDERDPFILVGGKNGAGKTHLLRALYLGVVGEPGVGDLKKVEAGSDATRFSFERSLNRKAEREGQDTAKLSVVLRQRDLNGGNERTLTLVREIRHRPNSKPVWTTYASRSTGAKQSSAELEARNAREEDDATISKWRDAFLPRDLARFFFFDAERSQSVQLGEKDIVDGVSKILGLTAYEELEQDLRQLTAIYIPKQYELSSGTDAASKAGEYSGKIIDFEAQVRGHQNHIETLKLEKAEAGSELAEVEERLRSFGAVNPEKLSDDQNRRDEIAKAKLSIESKLEEAWERALPVALLGDRRQELHTQLLNEERRRTWEDRKASVEPKIPALKSQVFDGPPEKFVLSEETCAFYSGRFEDALRGLFHPPPEGIENVEVFVTARSEISVAIRHQLGASDAGLAELVEMNDRLERLEADLRDLDYEIRRQTQDTAARAAGDALHTQRGELLQKLAQFDRQIADHEAAIVQLEAQLVEFRGEEKKWREAEAKRAEALCRVRSEVSHAQYFVPAEHFQMRLRQRHDGERVTNRAKKLRPNVPAQPLAPVQHGAQPSSRRRYGESPPPRDRPPAPHDSRLTVKLPLGGNERHPVNGEIPVVGRQHHRALVPAGQQHCARVGVVHGFIPPAHFRQDRDRRRVLHVHLRHESFQKLQGAWPVVQNVSGFRDGRARDNERTSGSCDQRCCPAVILIGRVGQRHQRPRIKYYDRRGSGHGEFRDADADRAAGRRSQSSVPVRQGGYPTLL